MATQANDEAFLQKYGNYKPTPANVPVTTIKPIIGGETTEQAAARRAEEERRVAAEERAKRGEQRAVESTTFDQIGKIRTEFLGIPEVKEFRGVTNATRQIIGLAQGEGSPMGDIGLIFSYMKTLDPGSVVREGEQASAQNAAGVPERIRNYYNQLIAGERLSPEQRADMANTAISIYNTRKIGYEDLANTYRGLLTDLGADPDRQGITLPPVLEFGAKPQDQMDAAGGQVAPKQAGQLFQTDEDIAAQRQLQDAWNSGASVEQIIQLQQQLGRGAFSPEDIQRMQNARAQNKPEAIQFYASPTGSAGAVEETLGKIAGTAAGGYGIGAYNALTGGFAVPEEIKQYVEATSPVASTLGEITGTTLATIPAGRLVGALAPGLGATRAMLAGDILVGGAQGAGASPEDMLRGTLYGAGGAALGGALANRFLPGGTGTWLGGESQAPRRLMAPDITEGLAGAQQANIPVMTSDVRPPETFFGKSVQQAQERIPFAGTGGARATQQTARTTAVQELYSDYGITNARNLAPELADDILTRNEAIKTKYNNQKTEVINRLAGKGVVPVDNAVAELDKQIADLARRNTEEANEAIAVLQDHRAQLLQDRDLFQVEAFRKDTLAKAFDSDTMKPGTRDLGEAALRAVYPKLNDDMGAFIKIVGDSRDFNKWKVANKELSKAIEDAKVKSLQNAIKNGQATPELFENILFSARRSDVERLYNNMSPNGRSVARMAILNRVLEKSKAEGIEELTPDKFRSKMKDFADQVDVFFEGAEGERIKGLLAALNLTRRAGEAGVSTNTGQQLFYTALGTALTGGAAAIPTVGASAIVPMAVAGSLGLAGKIYESKPVRNLLMQISKAKAGAQQDSLIAKFWDVVGKQIPAGAGAVAGAQMAPEAEREGSIQITPGTPAP